MTRISYEHDGEGQQQETDQLGKTGKPVNEGVFIIVMKRALLHFPTSRS
jgi:hypothetical protein